MAEYLNLDGLKILWAKAKNTFVPKTRKINDKELSSDVNLVLGDIVPIVSKTFSNVIGSAADQANANFFFGKLTPFDKSVYVQCRARYRLYAWIHDASQIPSTDTNKTNNVYTRGWFDVEINVRGETLVVYKVWNNHSSTSYKTITYHELGRAKSATIQAGGGHILGVRTRDAYSPVATGWNRDYRIDILELENCTFEFFDEMKKHSVAYTSDFVALTEIDGTNNGLRESGDDNDTSTIYSSSTGYVVGTNGMQQYSLCAIDKDGKLQSFTKTAGTGTTKTVNDAKFKFPLVLYRYSQSTNRANGYYFKDNWIQKIVASFDARYSCNRGTVFNSNAGPVYLEGTIDDDGYFSVSSNILTQTFSEGKVYVHVGHPYNASAAATNVYNINLDATHPAYYYDGTNLVPYEEGRYAKKTDYDSHVSNSDVHVTASDKETWNGKASASHTHKVKINGIEKTVYASGGATCDLGDFLTEHQSLDGLVQKSGDTMTGNLTAPKFYATERFQVKVGGTDRRIALVADSDGYAKIKGDEGRDVLVFDGSTIRAKCLWVFDNNVVFNDNQLFAKAYGDEYSNRLSESYLSFRNNIPCSFFNASMDSSGSWTYVQRWTFECPGSKNCLYEFDFLINYDCGDDNRSIRVRVYKTGGSKDELIWTYAAYVRSHGFIHIPAKIFGSYTFMKVEIVPEMDPGHSGGSYHAIVNSVRTKLEPDAMFIT